MAHLVSLTSLALLGACGFAHKNFNQSSGPFENPDDFVIQVDDLGSFWDPDVPAHALDVIARSARSSNTVIILVVHGWHHNAAQDDEFAIGFARAMRDIRQILDDNVDGVPGTYRRSRQYFTGSGDVNIFGIYVAWRGKSLPMPFDYLTFWDRKSAAERVGSGDLREFLLRLNDIYRASYQDRLPSSPYVGMASIGHSFGAQVLFKSVSSSLEKELVEATQGNPATPSAPGRRLARPLEGFGDIVVLVNPALEAFQFERIRRLDAQLTYDRRQPPLLLVLSADTDVSRRWLFPLGRWASSLFNAPMRDEQADAWSHALGEYKPQRTHKITFLPNQGSLANLYITSLLERPCDIVNFDLTAAPTIAHVRLEPIEGHHNPHSPFLIAYGAKDVIFGHSGVFERELRNFINEYIAITRAKRLLLAEPGMQDCPEPSRQDVSRAP